MKPYDAERAYLTWYFSHYRHVIVVREHIPHDWMDQNLAKTFTSHKEDCMGQRYTREIVGYGCSKVGARPDTEIYYFFHDPKHVQQIIAAMPEIVVTDDPFGPDPQNPHPVYVTGWRRVVARLIGIPV